MDQEGHVPSAKGAKMENVALFCEVLTVSDFSVDTCWKGATLLTLTPFRGLRREGTRANPHLQFPAYPDDGLGCPAALWPS